MNAPEEVTAREARRKESEAQNRVTGLWLRATSDYDCCAYYHSIERHRDDLCPVVQSRGGKALCEWIGGRTEKRGKEKHEH